MRVSISPMFRVLVAAAAVLAATPATAVADTHYGGSAVRKGVLAGPAMSVVVSDDGRVVARLAMGHRCRGFATSTLVIRLSGRTNGQAVTATGRTRLRSGVLRARLTGTLAPDALTGRVRIRQRGCHAFTRSFVLRGPTAPAGGPAGAMPGSLLHGLTGQSAGGVRLPVSIRVARNGRIYAFWQAMLKCRRGSVPMLNVTPPTTVRPDGTFSRTETYTIRYRRPGRAVPRDVQRRFLADGAVGTLRARMVWRQPGVRYYPCLSGTQNWVARPVACGCASRTGGGGCLARPLGRGSRCASARRSPRREPPSREPPAIDDVRRSGRRPDRPLPGHQRRVRAVPPGPPVGDRRAARRPPRRRTSPARTRSRSARGVGGRLPTRAEWDAAAGEHTWPWGDTFDPERCNCAEAGVGLDDARPRARAAARAPRISPATSGSGWRTRAPTAGACSKAAATSTPRTA